MRNRQWLRGAVYGADGMKIVTTSGNAYGGCGRIWDPDQRKHVYGHKVVYISDPSHDRPRIVAPAMGPINIDERELLLEALGDLRTRVCPPKDAEKLRSEMERQERKTYLFGYGAVVVVPGRRIYAAMSYKRYVDLSSLKATRRVGELVAQGMSVEEALSLISGEQQT
ncbi:MAG: hypothetical protein BWY92_01660 [Firmicutes bacterium ADurb.BinA052]|nr:MAG: hypothetical protein BWY92_01660 [Firmicutes bacterium ADurb.BinA052]